MNDVLEWKLMESAPQDGTRFLASHEKSGVIAITWHGKTSHVPLYGALLQSVAVYVCRAEMWSPLASSSK